jgi:hypothetical protein
MPTDPSPLITLDPCVGRYVSEVPAQGAAGVFVGTDPDTDRRIDRTATSRGTRAQAQRELAAIVARVRLLAMSASGHQ